MDKGGNSQARAVTDREEVKIEFAVVFVLEEFR